MLDNATNNDTAMAALGGEFRFDSRERRLRCAGHILNFVAREILYGKSAEIFSDAVDNQTAELAELEVWRRKGPVGKLHNVVKYITASPKGLMFLKRSRIWRIRKMLEKRSSSWWSTKRHAETQRTI